jgi:hypothetical protein
MHVAVRVAAAMMVGRARVWIGAPHRQFMFFDLAIGTLVMQMPIV